MRTRLLNTTPFQMKAFGVRWHTIIASPSIMVSAASAVHLGAVTGLVVLMIQLYPDRLDFFVPLAFAVFPAGLLWHAARERMDVHVGILQFIEVGVIVSMSCAHVASRLVDALACGSRILRLAVGMMTALALTPGLVPSAHGQDVDEAQGFRQYFPQGFEAEFEFTINNEYERNTDLDDDEDTDIGVAELELAAAFAYEITDWFSTELELVLGRDFFFIDDEKDESPDLRLELDRAILVFSDVPLDGLEVGLGRQKITDEPRKFVVDEALDGIRVVYDRGSFLIDAALGRERRVDKDLLNDDDNDENPDVDYASFFFDYRLKEGLVAGPYLFYLDDHEGEESQRTYLGLRSSGLISPQILHWLDLSYVTGDEGDTDIEGIALDSAISYLFDAALSPSVSVGYAFGSGDDGEDEGDSDAFRQTGLQSNEAKFHGIPRFKYLGEALEPELRNLHVFTAGIGVRHETVSADLVYHHYRLDKTGGELGDTRIDAELRDNSSNDHVGDGIDLVFGFREIAGFENVGADLVGGWFRAGDAFAEDNDDDAFFVKFELAVEF